MMRNFSFLKSGKACGISEIAYVHLQPAWSTMMLSTGTPKKELALFDAVSDRPDETLSFENWYSEMKTKLKTGYGPVMMGKKTPFPYNPEFKPTRPISEKFRRKVYDMWASDPTMWSHRQLSSKFKISLERVEAIIKLREMQKKSLDQGIELNLDYQSSMEKLLDARDLPDGSFSDIEDGNANLVSKLICYKEDTVVAHSISNGSSIPSVKNSGSSDAPLSAETCSNASETIIEKDIRSGRWNFVFIDLDNISSQKLQIRVREKTGKLRTATMLEAKNEIRLLKLDKLRTKSQSLGK